MVHDIIKQPDGKFTVVYTAKDGRRYIQTDFEVQVGSSVIKTKLSDDVTFTAICALLGSDAEAVRGD